MCRGPLQRFSWELALLLELEPKRLMKVSLIEQYQVRDLCSVCPQAVH